MKHDLIALALPKDGIYERGVATFRRVVNSLKPLAAQPH